MARGAQWVALSRGRVDGMCGSPLPRPLPFDCPRRVGAVCLFFLLLSVGHDNIVRIVGIARYWRVMFPVFFFGCAYRNQFIVG